MNTSVTARHFDLTPEIKARALEEMDNLTRYFERIISAEYILDTERHRRIAELRVKAYGQTLSGTAETDDMIASIDQAADKMKKQLKKHKGKLKDKKPEEIEELTEATTSPETDVDAVDM